MMKITKLAICGRATGETNLESTFATAQIARITPMSPSPAIRPEVNNVPRSMQAFFSFSSFSLLHSLYYAVHARNAAHSSLPGFRPIKRVPHFAKTCYDRINTQSMHQHVCRQPEHSLRQPERNSHGNRTQVSRQDPAEPLGAVPLQAD